MPKLTSPVTLIFFLISILLFALSFFKKKTSYKNKLLVILRIFLFIALSLGFQTVNKAEAYECNNGPSNTNAGGCGVACGEGNPWSKYDKIPFPGSTPSGYVCFPGGFCLKYLSYTCSTADKCVNPSDNALHAGYCDCSVGGIYKVCCNGVNRVACVQLNQDSISPPEGVCSGTTVYGTSCPSSGGGGTTTVCGDIGGTYCNHSDSSCPSGTSPLGATSDCIMCCGTSGSGVTPPPVSTPTPGGGGGSTPVWDAGRCAQSNQAECTDWGDGSNLAAWCACELKCTGANSSAACTSGGGGGGVTPPPSGCGPCEWGGCGASDGCGVAEGYGEGWRRYHCTHGGCRPCLEDPTCLPTTCTITMSPTSLSLEDGDSAELTAGVNVTNVTSVIFSSRNNDIAQAGSTTVTQEPYHMPVYHTTVYSTGAGTTSISATANLTPSGSCTTSIPVTVEAGAWFQTQGGDVYTGGNLASGIPETATDLNLSVKLDNWPGFIIHQDTNGVNLGSGFPSNDVASNWLALSKYEGKAYGSFQFFKKKFATQMAQENYSSGGVNAPSVDDVYYAKSSRTLSGDWTLGDNRWIVILVEGDVYVNTDIIVPKGSFLAIAATGSIVFNSSVTKAQGMFVADSRIDMTTGTTAFEGQGVFVASNFVFGRDFEDDRNHTTPVENFIARPDFIMSSYKDSERNVWWFYQTWKELAP